MTYHYCGFNEGDVYVYVSSYGGFRIHRNGDDENTIACATRVQLLNHLTELRAEGLSIPESTFERLREEIQAGLTNPTWDGELN
jgi:hypothetical protein